MTEIVPRELGSRDNVRPQRFVTTGLTSIRSAAMFLLGVDFPYGPVADDSNCFSYCGTHSELGSAEEHVADIT